MRSREAGTFAAARLPGRPGQAGDESLIAGVARGDREAIGALYDLYAPAMFAVAARMLGGPREAQDLVHDVFLEAWLHASEYDPERGSLRGWLMLRLRSRALDRMGRAEATRSRSLEDGDPSEDAREVSPPIDQVDRITLRSAVDRLDSDVRETLDLTYFRGLTAQAISETTGVPVGTVRSRLARGLRELRDGLAVPGRRPTR